MDASLHLWLEDRGLRLALVDAIDHATNDVVSAQLGQNHVAKREESSNKNCGIV